MADLRLAAAAAGVPSSDMDAMMTSPRAHGELPRPYNLAACLLAAAVAAARWRSDGRCFAKRRNRPRTSCLPPCPHLTLQLPHTASAGHHDHDDEAYEDAGGLFELPSVDDLEVAAAAAAAAMEALATHGQNLAESSSGDDSDDGDSDDSSSNDEDGSGSEAMDVDGEGGGAAARVSVSLLPDPARPGAVRLALAVVPAPAAPGLEVEEDSSPLVSSSSEDESSSSSDGGAESDEGEPLDYNQMRGLIDKAYAAVDAEDEESAGFGGGPKALHAALGLQEGAPSLADVQLQAGEARTHVGNVTAVVEDMAVVQGLSNMPALAEG
jgi:hypothetical protein